MDEKRHGITLEERKRLCVTECSEVVSFNENEVVLNTKEDSVVICGENLKVEEVSKATGEAVITGEVIDSIVYKKGKRKNKEGIIGRLLK